MGSRCTIIYKWMAYSIITVRVVYSATTPRRLAPCCADVNERAQGCNSMFHVSNMSPTVSLSDAFTTLWTIMKIYGMEDL